MIADGRVNSGVALPGHHDVRRDRPTGPAQAARDQPGRRTRHSVTEPYRMCSSNESAVHQVRNHTGTPRAVGSARVGRWPLAVGRVIIPLVDRAWCGCC